MGRILLQKKELVWFGCVYNFLLPQTMLPSNDQIANQSCYFDRHKMATRFGVGEKCTRNRFQLRELLPIAIPYTAQVTFPGPIQALLLLQDFASNPVSIDYH